MKHQNYLTLAEVKEMMFSLPNNIGSPADVVENDAVENNTPNLKERCLQMAVDTLSNSGMVYDRNEVFELSNKYKKYISE